MKLTEIDREMERLSKLREDALRKEQEKALIEATEEARDILGRMVDDLRRIEDLGFTPPRLKEALTDAQGKYNPGLYVKRPKKRSA